MNNPKSNLRKFNKIALIFINILKPFYITKSVNFV